MLFFVERHKLENTKILDLLQFVEDFITKFRFNFFLHTIKIYVLYFQNTLINLKSELKKLADVLTKGENYVGMSYCRIFSFELLKWTLRMKRKVFVLIISITTKINMIQ